MNDSLQLLPSRLCYVEDGSWAWFTTQPIESQWGSSWETQPFEYDSGAPFEWMPNSNTVPYSLTVIGFKADLFTPPFFAPSIKVSVQEINAKAMPWLRSGPWNNAQIEVWAGATITEFLDAITAIGGQAFMEI